MPYVRIGDYQLEYAWYGPGPTEAPTLVFLHEGLGSLQMWREFPARLAAALGYGALVYSRPGYGKSDPNPLPWPVEFMHHEALIRLPQVLGELKVRDAILFGHSDGGSIALIHAGSGAANHVRGLILEAPHVFVEEIGLESIKQIAGNYENGTLKASLERYHGGNVDNAFWGWNQVWLDPRFRSWNIEGYLPGIEVPLLVIQGEDDRYGTMRQVELIQKGCKTRVDTVVLPDCGHSPHRDQPEATMAAAIAFLQDPGQ